MSRRPSNSYHFFMFKMIKVILVLIGLGGLAYFAFFVPLGEHTLYEHLVGISETDQAQQLGDEIEKKAQDISEDVAESVPALIGEDDDEPAEPGTPLSQISDEDRTALSELLKQKNK